MQRDPETESLDGFSDRVIQGRHAGAGFAGGFEHLAANAAAVVVGFRDREHREQPVAHELQHLPAMGPDRRDLAVEIMIEDIHHRFGREPIGQRGEAAQIRQPDRGMHGVGVAAPDLAAHDALTGAVADIVVEQAQEGAAHVDDLDDPRQRPHDRSQRGQFVIAKAARLPGGPARSVDRTVDEKERHRDIVGDTLPAYVVEERKAPALGIVEARADLPSGVVHDRQRAPSIFRRIRDFKAQGIDDDLLARPPEEGAAVNIGMQRPDKHRDAPQRQACRHQPFTGLRHQPRRGGRGPRAVDQPVGDVLQIGCVHEADILQRCLRKRQGDGASAFRRSEGRGADWAEGVFRRLGGCNGGLSSLIRPSPTILSAHLPAMPQKMIRQHAGHHGFADRHRADADAGIVTALGEDVGVGARAVHRAAR